MNAAAMAQGDGHHQGQPEANATIAQVLALSQNWGPLMADVVLVHLGTNE